MSDSDHVLLGVDVGTTATKVVAFDARGATHAEAVADYPLQEPHPGRAEQDPDAILEAVLGAVRQATQDAEAGGARVAGLSFSSAMHSLLALDRRGRPATPSVIWADTRAAPQAERLRADPIGLELHRRTGTPVHPMSPLAKLIWFREQESDVFAGAWKWIGIKDYLFHHLTGEYVMDHSCASGTGLMQLSTLDWDSEALAVAGIDAGRLPELVPSTYVAALTEGAAGELGLAAGTPVVAGGGDGPLANLGIGAVHPGQAACSIGTSAALRVMVEDPAVDPEGGVFCYAFLPGRWVVGGALNNGGVVLGWAHDALAPELGDDAAKVLSELAATAPAGAGGLLMLPYLLGERAPRWSSLPRGAYIGLTRAHRREHLVRAALEGVCLQLALVHDSMRAADIEVREVRATGGFARSAFWRQLLADVLGVPIAFPAGHEGSSFGAALLGMEALQLVGSIDLAADLVRVESTVTPDAATTGLYADLRPVFRRLFDQLVPAFEDLRRLAPQFAADVSPGAHPDAVGGAQSAV